MLHTGIEIILYSVDELEGCAKAQAIKEMREFELSIMSPADYEGCGDPELDTPESMYEEDYNDILFNDERVMDDIRANDYMYFANGHLAAVTHYCGAHPLSGETHFTFAGKDYKIGG